MEGKPIGALGVVVVLVLTILVFWLGVYAILFARG
ncbi:MAG: cytochrome c oxidase subunit 2A [Thermus sp.]